EVHVDLDENKHLKATLTYKQPDVDENGESIEKEIEAIVFINKKLTDLRIEKEVQYKDSIIAVDKLKEFEFTIELIGINKDELKEEFKAEKYDGDDNRIDVITIKSGDAFTLRNGDYLIIKDLPEGTTYTVTETESDDWELKSSEGTNGVLEAGLIGEAKFINTNIPPVIEDTSIILTANKEMFGGKLKETDNFTFELKDEKGEVLQSKGVDKFGDTSSTVTFDEINYTVDDRNKTFVYTISEVKGSNINVTYDETVYKVEVKVTLNEKTKKLDTEVVTKIISGTEETVITEVPTFVNKKSADLLIKKAVDTYVDSGANNTFVFEVTIKDKETGEEKYSNVVGLTLNYGEMEGEVRLENLPLDPETDEVTVEEIYSAGYEGTVEIEYDEATRTYIAKVDNKTTDITHGSGAVNNYSNKKYVRVEEE
ncbi:MAG: hypothetical protein IJ115_08605, partial [Erysipelotrichaceae bacterium]|nr:hypothetical protein [Erysipelotrichaceae bacterium]